SLQLFSSSWPPWWLAPQGVKTRALPKPCGLLSAWSLCTRVSAGPGRSGTSTTLSLVRGGPTQGWAVAASETVWPPPLPSQCYPPLKNPAPFLLLMGLHAFSLSHPFGSKRHESKSLLYPYP
uniref:Uncharacterized protein n=1 Tax=Monodon monoceros TaxID=40151 RepID=A0A8C6C2E8_MONMO